MDSEKIERITSKIARIYGGDGNMRQACVDSMEWAIRHQWNKPSEIKIVSDKEYLLRLPDGYVVAEWSKGDTFADESGIYHWRNGRLWYPDGLVLAIMEIPRLINYETD